MAIPRSRDDLIEWSLRKLGAPVLEINISADQIEDRIDECLMYFRDYHFDGVERIYFVHRIQSSVIVATADVVGDFEKNDILVGQTSGATGYFYDKDGRNVRWKKQSLDKDFIVGEIVVNERSGAPFIISSITIGDIDNKFIEVPDRFISITNILKDSSPSSAISGGMGGLFSFQFQWLRNNVFSLAQTDLISFYQFKGYMSQWDFLFKGLKALRFNRKCGKVYIDAFDYNVDDVIILEVYAALDPEEYVKIYSDEFVREYACALLKLQWGTNLKKFSGVQLPGGITLNGQQIYDEANAEILELRRRMQQEFQLPVDFIIG